MKRQVIGGIIILMSIALIGLAGFQVYWINHAISVNQEQFEQKVQESLLQVSKRMEKQEAFNFTIQQFNHQFRKNYSQSTTIILQSGENAHDTLRINDINSASEKEYEKQLRKSMSQNIYNELKNARQELKYAERFFNQNKVANKFDMVEVVIEEMLHGGRSIQERINPEMLDSMLTNEFKLKGIDIDYQFAVWDHNRDTSVVYTNSPKHLHELKKSSLRASLFPNDLFFNSNFLTVHFPDENTYLLKKMWAILTTSVVFILIIIGCFSYAIYTIIRQKKISEIKNDFINNMTHELKTPIATVGLACEALHEKEMRGNESILLRYLGVIKDENKRLSDQVEKVLQAALLEKTSFQLKKTTLPLHELIASAIGKINFTLEARDGKLTQQLAAKNDVIVADADHIFNVVVNLLDNAIKYSPHQPDITVKTSNKHDGVVIEVTDKGQGMKRDELKKIFDKFYRVHTGDRHDVKGFGLGLSYVKSIVNMHGGDVSAISEFNEGSTFSVFLPFNDGE